MNQGFKIHKTAVTLEVSLNRMIAQNGGNEIVDITMIYDQPISLICEVLHSLQPSSEGIRNNIRRFLRSYEVYQSKLLMQMEERVLLRLCDDLERLLKEMKTS